MPPATAPVVVKLGGSFAFSATLTDWIRAFASCAGRVVIVPGGGPFADTVRTVQRRMGFDDRAAHLMSLLAMEQYGQALICCHDLLQPADSVECIDRHLAAQRVPVWMPARMAAAAPDVEPSWRVTSDSLAAWLSGTIGADRLILVKHVDALTGLEQCQDLVAMGVVDEAFPQYLRKAAVSASLVGPADHAILAAAIRCGTVVGFPIQQC
jgi:5-(aminomethyl)-3-furanmethanol phosphate kinase